MNERWCWCRDYKIIPDIYLKKCSFNLGLKSIYVEFHVTASDSHVYFIYKISFQSQRNARWRSRLADPKRPFLHNYVTLVLQNTWLPRAKTGRFWNHRLFEHFFISLTRVVRSYWNSLSKTSPSFAKTQLACSSLRILS